MPHPKTDAFCPQCGCVKFSKDEPHTRKFECGEVVRTGPIGVPFLASYTCKTIPERVPVLESSIAAAVDMVSRGNLPFRARVALIQMRSDSVDERTIPRTAVRFLRDNKLVTSVAGTNKIKLTHFGRLLAAKVKELTPV